MSKERNAVEVPFMLELKRAGKFPVTCTYFLPRTLELWRNGRQIGLF
ncbi:MAG: hypothetical protein AABN95_14430 [Acidobacteriota bacterium]